MKLCSFNVGEINRIGVLMSNGQVADCNYAYAAYQKAKGTAAGGCGGSLRDGSDD